MTNTFFSYERLKVHTPSLLLFVLAFALFSNTFFNGWTYDDFPVIVENPDVTSWSSFLLDRYPGRPLREISYLLDHALFGLNPTGWHIQNIFWHGLNATLIFHLVTRISPDRCVAWLTSLLFLLHPIQVEVVANISHRKDSLALAFSLIAVILYLNFLRSGRRILSLTLCTIALYVACQAKQNALVLPLVFVACEAAFASAENRFLLRSKYLVLSAGVLALAVFAAWFFWGDGQARYDQRWPLLLMKMDFFSAPSTEAYLFLLLKSWVFMLGKLFFPADLALEYTYTLPSSWFDPWVLSCILILILYVASLFSSFKRNKTLFFFLAWSGLFWLPTSNLWPLSYFAADRYLYAPSVGIFASFAIVAAKTLRSRRTLFFLALPLLAVLALLTWNQNSVWHSPETLWVQASEVSPHSSFALNNLGNVYLLKGNLFKAQEHYLEAVQANPTNPTGYYNLALIYERIGDRENALKHYRIFLSLDSPPFRQQAESLKGYLLKNYGILVK